MKNLRNFLIAGCAVLLFLFSNTPLYAQDALLFSPNDIDIPHKKYVLDNGLRLIVHEDHKAPIVAVNVWYHVGSKNEKTGKSGFAHLFEHLMFNGSENFNDDYFQALERIGATDLNGTTNNDRTNYFQNVPTSGLDQVLFLESDRMGHLLGAIDQAKLDEQRGVVQNEKRQGENQPYGRQYDLITKSLWPKGHPYSWTVIGEMEDLNAASLEDVKEWFKSYYGAANAVISIAGDVDTEEVMEKVKKYFGDIPAGPTMARQEVNIPKRLANTRQYYQDRVPESRILQTWVVPEWGSKEAHYLDLATDVLASGKNSRLYKKLVYEDQTASYVSASIYPMEIAGTLSVMANVKPGEDREKVEQTLNQLVEKFLKEGPSEQELNRVKAQYFARFIKGIERIGGFGGKSDILAMNEIYGNSPDYYKQSLNIIANATTEDIRKAAQKWMAQGKHSLICDPFPNYTTLASEVDRSTLPSLGKSATATFPAVHRGKLKNGMQVVLAQRKGIPTIVMNLLFNAGYAADQGVKAGTASLAMNMMDEGTESYSSLEINEKLQLLGASLNTSSDLDMSYVNMNTLKPSFQASLDLFAEVVLRPAFQQDELDRLKKQQLASIQREKATPVTMALRVLPKFLYGDAHAYSIPLTGSGYEHTVQTISRDDITSYYQKWIRPNNATLVVVGDLEMGELLKQLEAKFGAWEKGKLPAKNIHAVQPANRNKLYVMDRPESQQSIIVAGKLIQPYGDINEIARETMNNVLGGEFTSRVNMNLREDKHWAYGAFTLVWNAKGQRPLLAYAPVQTDKTKESIQELQKELSQFVGDKPVTQAELTKVKENRILKLPGQWETNGSVAGSLNNIVKYNLKDDYYQKFDQNVRSLDLEEVRKLSKLLVKPQEFNWLVVGDKEKIMASLQELDFDEIITIDPNGNPLEPSQPKIKTEKGK
ncbi:pitrilysin family protein [Rapidithrix thailandica]|uniref:Pitrilysin family protein n=1 Tax=Rapidithrix thailandica TaxID=413964 RepID=A0AAW9RXK2_9BACT